MYSYQSHIPAHIGNLKKKKIKRYNLISKEGPTE